MSYRIKVIHINHHTGSVAVRTLKLRYANAQAAQATARQLCTVTPYQESKAVVYAQRGH